MATIFIATNAVSGDMQGAHIAKKLREIDPEVRLYGSGGERMRAAGVDVRVKSDHLACVGIIASLPFLREMHETLVQQKAVIRAQRPHLAVLLDNEGTFNEMLAAFLKRERIPIIHYFPPLVWLWGEWRAKKIARNAHAIVSAFPNEVSIYKKVNGRVFYFGHPLVDVLNEEVKSDSSKKSKDSGQLLGLMPGSRVQEVEMLTAPMLDAARLLKQKHPKLHFILPVAASFVRPILEREIARQGVEQFVQLVEDKEYESLRSCSAVVVAAGTATIELALMKVPMLVIYRLGPVTYEFVRRLIRTPFIAMPNIILGRPVIPELRQKSVTPLAIAEELERLIADAPHRAKVCAGLEEVGVQLGSSGVLKRVAEFVINEAASLEHFLKLPLRPYKAPMTPRAGDIRQSALNVFGWMLAPIDALIWLVLEKIAGRYWGNPNQPKPVRQIGKMITAGFQTSTRAKMKLVLGDRVKTEEQLDQLMISYAEQRGLGLVEPIVFSNNPALGRDLITIKGESQLNEALAESRGAMFLLSHLGPMTCVPASFGPRGYDITFSGTPMHRPYYEIKMRQMLSAARTKRGVIGDDLPRLARTAFARNGIFTAFMDYTVTNRHSVRVSLGEAETCVSVAPTVIALRNNVPIFFVKCMRENPTSFYVELIRLLPPAESLSIQKRAEELIRCAFALFSEDLIQRPSEWWVWDFAQIDKSSRSAASPNINSRRGAFAYV